MARPACCRSTSLSITASPRHFEEFFHVRLREAGGSVTVVDGDPGDPYVVPLHSLPEDLGPHVFAVTFTPPPDFGPTEFFGP